MILELENINHSFIRKKLGLKKADEHKYKPPYYIDPQKEQRPYHKRLDFTGGSAESPVKDAFEHNKKICDIFKCYFKNVSFSVHSYKGTGFYYIYPKYVKKHYEEYDDKHFEDFCDLVNGTIIYKHYYKKYTCDMGTTEIINDILTQCYLIERTISIVREDTVDDIKSIINNKLDRLFF